MLNMLLAMALLTAASSDPEVARMQVLFDVSSVQVASLAGERRESLLREATAATPTPGGLRRLANHVGSSTYAEGPFRMLVHHGQEPQAVGTTRTARITHETRHAVDYDVTLASRDESSHLVTINLAIDEFDPSAFPPGPIVAEAVLPAGGGRTAFYVDVPGRPDVTYLVRVTTSPESASAGE